MSCCWIISKRSYFWVINSITAMGVQTQKSKLFGFFTQLQFWKPKRKKPSLSCLSVYYVNVRIGTCKYVPQDNGTFNTLLKKRGLFQIRFVHCVFYFATSSVVMPHFNDINRIYKCGNAWPEIDSVEHFSPTYFFCFWFFLLLCRCNEPKCPWEFAKTLEIFLSLIGSCHTNWFTVLLLVCGNYPKYIWYW